MRQRLRFLVQWHKLRMQGLAETCGISRVTIHRFLNGDTEMRSGDFIRLLKELGIDVEAQVEREFSSRLNETTPVNQELKEFVGEVFGRLDPRVQRGVLQNILWWLKHSSEKGAAALVQQGEQLEKDYYGSKATLG